MTPSLITFTAAALTAILAWIGARRVQRSSAGKIDAERLNIILETAAGQVVEMLRGENSRLASDLKSTRFEVHELRIELAAARAEISQLQRMLAVERVEHDTTKEQVQTLQRVVASITPMLGTPVIEPPKETQ